jgi:hypothetical protein
MPQSEADESTYGSTIARTLFSTDPTPHNSSYEVSYAHTYQVSDAIADFVSLPCADELPLNLPNARLWQAFGTTSYRHSCA